MFFLCRRARSFYSYIGSWNVSSVTTMASMFRGASAFNQDIGSWNVSSVTDMSDMFRSASSFDQDLSGWCVQSNFASEPSNFKNSAPISWTSSAAKQPDWDGADGSGANCS